MGNCVTLRFDARPKGVPQDKLKCVLKAATLNKWQKGEYDMETKLHRLSRVTMPKGMEEADSVKRSRLLCHSDRARAQET